MLAEVAMTGRHATNNKKINQEMEIARDVRGISKARIILPSSRPSDRRIAVDQLDKLTITTGFNQPCNSGISCQLCKVNAPTYRLRFLAPVAILAL